MEILCLSLEIKAHLRYFELGKIIIKAKAKQGLNRFCCDLREPLIVTTPLEEVFMAKYVYKSCVVRVKSKDTLADLVLLMTLDFDVILDMNWLAPCFTKVDCHYKHVKLNFSMSPHLLSMDIVV
ncbi:hypothetical protein QQP08_007048 [Theobroma cacao]|nr:hypothetical protein QQP08_007048 [Theobroma cacao]